MIPPSSTLHFDVELVQVADGEVPPNVFKEIDIDGDQHLTRDEVSCTQKRRMTLLLTFIGKFGQRLQLLFLVFCKSS